MTNQKRKENRRGLILFCAVSLFLAGCLLLFKIQPWGSFKPHGTAVIDHSDQEEEASASTPAPSVDPLSEKYGPLYDIHIDLQFDNETERLDIHTIADWVTVQTDNDTYSYTVDAEAVSRYTQSLAEKYNNFESYLQFQSVDGTEKTVLNHSTGWIFDDGYAAEQLTQYITDNQSVKLSLTDRSQESNRWWHRVSSDYNAPQQKGEYYAEVSIEQQHLWVHKNGKIVLESPVVTGNPNTGHDTPPGGYVVYNKEEGATLYGPGYETEVKYWIGFHDDIGFHDAYWQDDFGGEVYLENGSHGCVNLPDKTAAELYKIAYVNMPVYVY